MKSAFYQAFRLNYQFSTNMGGGISRINDTMTVSLAKSRLWETETKDPVFLNQ